MALKRIPVIIDTDPGVDDIIALLLALSSPELEILAIVVSFGNTDLESSYFNVLKTYQAVQRHLELRPQDANRFPNFFHSLKTILARGNDGPLQGELHSAMYFHGRDGLGNTSERHPELNVQRIPASHAQLDLTDESGIDVVLELLKNHEARSITYIALGPLTNLACVMRRDSALVSTKVGRIVCMGGALDVPGNVTPVAEFNFFADPFAVKELLCPSEPNSFPLERFLLLPLDITTPHELSFPVYKQRVDSEFVDTSAPSQQSAQKGPITHFTSSFLEHTRENMLEFGKDAMELHDIVAVWCAITNPPEHELSSGWKVVRRKFDVERTGELTRGMLVIDRREDESAYSPGANRAEIQAELDRAHFAFHGNLESTALPAPVQIESVSGEGNKMSKQDEDKSGVLCVTRTPGPDVLLKLLLERVWGISSAT